MSNHDTIYVGNHLIYMGDHLTIYFALVIGSMIVLGGSALYGLYWGVREGHFSNMKKGSEVIFDKAEPVGKVTDVFPGMKLKKPPVKKKAVQKKKAKKAATGKRKKA